MNFIVNNRIIYLIIDFLLIVEYTRRHSRHRSFKYATSSSNYHYRNNVINCKLKFQRRSNADLLEKTSGQNVFSIVNPKDGTNYWLS